MSSYKHAFQARWGQWKGRIEYDIFDAVDDWLINGNRATEDVACIMATCRVSHADVFFMLADALAMPMAEDEEVARR